MILKFVIDKYSGISIKDVLAAIRKSGANVSMSDVGYDAVVIIGGDGSFLNHAINYKEPVLFIKGQYKGLLGSRGRLTYHKFQDLPTILRRLATGRFRIVEEPVLRLRYEGRDYFSIGDFYIEIRNTKEALRYKAEIKIGKKKTVSYAISNGFIVTTPLGSTGYFSYLDILEHRQPKRIRGVGFAHILPVMVKDFVNGKKVPYRIRRVFPIDSGITVYIKRNSSMLFGMPRVNSGVRINGGKISISAFANGIRKIAI